MDAKPIRSPSYPNMSLREAVEAVGKIEAQYRSNPVDRADAARLIGYSALSGPANKALAALASYGLLDRAGKGETRVTERARDILHAENEAQRRARLQEAALEPALYRELRDRFADLPVPPEDGVVTYLNRQGFNPNSVRPAAKAYRETMSFLQELGATGRSGAAGAEGRESDSPNPAKKFGGAAIGDFVQWEAGGILKMEKPARVRAISDDGAWVFVEQSRTGIPMTEVIVEQKAKPDRAPPTLELENTPAAKGSRKEVFALDEGDVTLIFPESLSETSFEDLEAYLQVFLRKAKRRAQFGAAEKSVPKRLGGESEE